MNEQELCRKRLLDLSRQADRKGIVLFSDFLNLNEQNIFHSLQKELYTTAELSGGYEQAERQMVAFIPDALCYEWSYPFVCIHADPQYPKYAEKLTHRDVLGALMHLGLDRSKIGDLIPHYISEGKNQLVISIGCTGGKHRSVTLANELYKRLSQKKNREYGLKIEHRDIGKDALRGK